MAVYNTKGTHTIIELTNVEDKELSWKAKGIHLYLISKLPAADFRMQDLIECSRDGRDGFYSGLRKLLDKGYVHMKRVRKNGKIVNYSYDVFETPRR